ncbi:MAG: S-layer homology domain-containing protein [Defluviitaleaceae bacterium]|nr:S-layer homology domain-containing protein [Defluviitaleaceae bacterium]
MKKLFARMTVILLCIAFLGIGEALQASDFRDVGPNFAWARDAINAVSDAGIMTGDLQGDFRPASYVTLFDAVGIFARMSGFNPNALDAQEAAYHNAIFEARRSAIEAVSAQFTSWNNDANREIAFLIYSDVLIPSDLDRFITIEGGSEVHRYLTREEAAVFLVRFMGRTQEALRIVDVPPFNDDGSISPGAKPHVYLLRSLGILNGDGSGNVNPRGAVTRAAMAVMVYSVLNEAQSTQMGHTPPGSTANIETMTGTIANTFAIHRAILTSSSNADHDSRIFSIAQTAIITIDGRNANFDDLARNMAFTATLHNHQIISITVLGSDIQSLEMEERFRQVAGTLTDKNFSENSLFPLLVVQDDAGHNHSFITDGASMISRQGMVGNISPRALRIGDAVEITAEFGRVTAANAVGTSSVVDVYIRDVFISGREQSYIIVSDVSYGTPGTPDRRHLIIDDAVDVNSLVVGSRVRLWLDSQEVADFILLQAAPMTHFVGHITQINNFEITVRDANFITRKFTHDADTIFFDSVTNRLVRSNELAVGIRVQVVATAEQTGRAASVTRMID